MPDFRAKSLSWQRLGESADSRGDLPRGTKPGSLEEVYTGKISRSAKGEIQGKEGRMEEFPFSGQ